MEQKRVSVVYNGNVINLKSRELVKHPDGYMFCVDSFRIIPSASKMPEIMMYSNNLPFARVKRKISFEGLDSGKRSGDLTIKINKTLYKIGTWKEVK